jgi:hypothetical protein
MYEHPYLSQRITDFEREQLERAVERRRFIKEHPEQIVARPAGPIRRMLRRLVAQGRSADRPVGVPCDAVPAR